LEMSRMRINRLVLLHVIMKAQPWKVAFFLAVMQSIQAAMAAHPTLYTGAPVDNTTFKAQVDALAAQHQATLARVPGAAALRETALRVVAGSAELLRAFVEQLCNNSPEQAATLAQSAGMYLSSRPPRAKVPLRVRQGANPGVVILYASVG